MICKPNPLDRHMHALATHQWRRHVLGSRIAKFELG
jgi:hypothetical protein